jgi:hypothetical protein
MSGVFSCEESSGGMMRLVWYAFGGEMERILESGLEI